MNCVEDLALEESMSKFILCSTMVAFASELGATGMVRYDIPGEDKLREKVAHMSQLSCEIGAQLMSGKADSNEVCQKSKELAEEMMESDLLKLNDSKNDSELNDESDNQLLQYKIYSLRRTYLYTLRDASHACEEIKGLYEKVMRHFQSQPSDKKVD